MGIVLHKPVAHNPDVESLYRYPRGIVGFALLLLRGSVGILLLANGCSEIFATNLSIVSLIRLIVSLGFCLGLFTPLLGIIAAAISLWPLLSAHMTLSLVPIAALILSIAIAILGPGAYSVDALLFGRRRVVF